MCRKFIKRWNNKRALLRNYLSGTTLSQYNVDVDSDENKKILQVRYLNELPSLINDLHLLPNVLTGIKLQVLKEYINITRFI